MSAVDTDKTKPRKQFLNVVYFVESSRTRTLKIPMTRVHLMLFCALLLIGWSVASAAIISLLIRDRADLVVNLKQSMQAVFDFESLYDGVYEMAYPAGKLQPAKVAVQPAAPAAEKPAEVSAPAKSSARQPVAAAVESKSQTPAEPVEKKDAVEKPGSGLDVIVSNPVVKTNSERMNLTFDLTNKDATDKSEGYLWAIAEFKTDTGETHILKAPLTIDVNEKGEIEDHKKASYFAIRRFKRNDFNFQLLQGQAGTVVGAKIGISDKSGLNKMIYDVPLRIKVGILKPNTKEPAAEDQKSGQG
jgi:hypothetical protein